MARLGRKYVALFELASVPGSDPVPSDDWASRVLRLMISANWADPSFLEELSESALIGTMCRVLPLLKANAANRATASCIQDLADLEEALRKLRHELALAEKRLPSHGVLGSGSGSYSTWASVGHVCTLMLQALAHGTAAAQAAATAATPRPSPPPLGAGSSRASPAPQVRPPTSGAVGAAPGGGGIAAAAGAENAEDRGNGTTVPAAAAASGGAAAAAAAGATSTDSPSGTSTPGASASKQLLGGGAVASPRATILGMGSTGSSMPALATEGALLKLLGNKHVVARAKEVLRVVPERYKAALARVLLSQLCAELKTTQASVVHILQILKGDPEATSPAPSALSKTWLNTAAILAAYSETLSANPDGGNGVAKTAATADGTATASTAKAGLTSFSTTPTPPAGPAPTGNAPMDSHDAANGVAGSSGSAAAAAAAADGPQGNDVEMAEALQSANQRRDADAFAAPSATEDAARSSYDPTSAGAAAAAGGASGGGAVAGTGADSTEPTAGEAARAPHAAAAAAADDPRATAAQLLEDVASSLCEAVTGAHGVGRVALLLRGEATGKYPSAAAYMPAALSINELMAQLDALACVGTALGAGDRLRPAISGLLASPAMKELLGSGKVYVTTVIAAGALTRDLDIDAVIPQSLRQGYMAAVLTPLETGALLNERRAPQVLAYRNSITESSYYQVMDADALPYGVNVRFEDEQEAEGMGVVREWLSQIAADIFSPDRGLFVHGAADRRVVHPAPHSRLQEDYLGYMRFAGRIVGLALRANVPLGVVLSTGLFNYMTGRRATLQDLQQLDPQVYTTCQNILSTSGAEALELYHVWHGQGGGGSEEQELLPGGASLRVTDDNKAAYVELLAQHVVVVVVEEQCAAFLAGVQDTAHHLPDDTRLRRAFLSPLLPDDLNRITAGESSLAPEDWAEHTDVAGFESVEEQQSLDMFWQLVSEYGPEERQRLLQFWTAMTHLPSGGFKALNQRLQIMKLGPPVAAAQQSPEATGAGELPTRAGEPASAAPAADAEAAAAATAAAVNGTGNGPATDAAGPHSHRLDGDNLEADEQEQSDASDEAAEDGGGQAAGQQAGQRQGSSAEAGGVAAAGDGGIAAGVQSLRAAPGWEQDAPGGASSAGPAGAATGEGVGVGSGAELGPASGRTDSAGRPIRSMDDEEMPYAEEEEEEEQGGAEEDDMDYGDDEELDEDELFQRQLALALELSLQDMPPAQPQPQPTERSAPSASPGVTAAAAAGGAAAGSSGVGGGQPGGEQGGSGDGGGRGSGSGDGGQVSEVPAAAAAEEGSQGRVAEEQAGAAGHANGEAGGPSGLDTDATVASLMAAAAAVGAGAPGAADDGEPAGPVHEPSLEAAPASDGGTDLVSEPTPPTPPPAAVADQGSPGHGLQHGTAAAAGAADAEGTSSSPPSAAAAPEGGLAATATAAAGGGDGGPPLPPPPGSDAPPDPMDAEAFHSGASDNGVAAASDNGVAAASDNGVAAASDNGVAAASDNGVAAAGASADAGAAALGEGAGATRSADGATDATAAATLASMPQHPEPEGRIEDRQLQGEQQGWQRREEQEGGQGLQVAASESEHQPQPQPREEAEGAEPQTPQQQLQPRGLEHELEAAGAMGDPVEGLEGPGPAAAPSQSATKSLPLLPQARTCFLQLNLPVYDSVEDVRRAFAIALDNMSFGLH